MAVEPDLRVGSQLGHHGLHSFLRIAEHQGSGRVHAVHALRAGVGHDPGLPGQLGRAGAVRHHQEADGLHAEFAS